MATACCAVLYSRDLGLFTKNTMYSLGSEGIFLYRGDTGVLHQAKPQRWGCPTFSSQAASTLRAEEGKHIA